VCLDVPYPANYGGAINMFHKIRWLHKSGVEIYLHCYTYGERVPSKELEKYCKEVHYYQRRTGLLSFLSLIPYNVKSRSSVELKENLLKNEYLILFEALHSCYWLNHKRFSHRKKIFRESNVEHDYFFHLAQNEKNLLKRVYLYSESFKLKRFERKLVASDLMLIVSKEDEKYFKNQFPSNNIRFMPSFHQNDDVTIKEGISDYVLYHGNLSVSENNYAAEWLIDHVFSRINYNVIIAGLNPPAFLSKKIAQFENIQLISNCSENQMNELVEHAQVHCLYTPQPTGLKLKLLNVLFKGRHVVCDPNMIAGTELARAVAIAKSAEDFILSIQQLMKVPFDTASIQNRRNLLERYTNQRNIKDLIDALEPIKV
jgi:hypothetical protein